MSLPSYLANIKSSGMYRFVWDKSEVDNSTNEILRLVVGYSEKGPFNTPVYIKSQQEFIKIFGGISKKLEKRGVFFHRLALQSLIKGPILALNLKKFSYEDAEHNQYSRVEGFSFNPLKDELIDGDEAYKIKQLKIEDIYDTTRFWVLDPAACVDAQEGGRKIMDKYISVVSADSKESSNTIFMRGISNKQYDVTVKEWYSAVASEEMPSYFEGYEDMMISDFLVKAYVFRGQFTKDLVSTSNLKKYFDITDDDEVVLKPYITNSFGEKIDTLDALADDESSNFINFYEGVTLPYFKDSKEQYISLDLLFNGDYTSHKMMMNFNSAFLDNGVDNEDRPFTVDMITTTGAGALEEVEGEIIIKNGIFNIPSSVKPTFEVATWDEEGTPKVFTFETVEGDSPVANFYKYVIGSGDTLSGTELVSTNTDKWISAGFSVGDRVLAAEGRLSTITSININYDEDNIPTDITIKFSKELFDDEGIYLYTHTLGDINANAKPYYLKGYTLMADDMKPKSLNQWDKLMWQKNILSTLTDYEGIRIGLTNRKDSSWRYIVSTFEGLVEEECQSVISLIAKEKDNAFAFLNFPSAQTFKTCPYSSFTDSDGKFKVKYVVEGRNKQKPASMIFTLASEGNGGSYCSYNTPLIFTDGTVKTAVPSAAMVCNNFMDKYTLRHPFDAVAGEKYGFMSASGLVGPDLNYSRDDLDLLEPFGVNAMVFEPQHGTYILSNQTAKQKPETALSKIHVRELTIWLQDEIEKMMRNYHWDKNTAALRDTIQAQAEKICALCVTNGGINPNFICKCDDENNTPEVIDREMIILSIHVEPTRCAGKMVQELTLYKTGGLSSVINE